ncbi:hypothetical protein LguiA_029184 [Lonicera macranthoides]
MDSYGNIFRDQWKVWSTPTTLATPSAGDVDVDHGPGSLIGNTKSSLMKKTKLDYLNSSSFLPNATTSSLGKHYPKGRNVENQTRCFSSVPQYNHSRKAGVLVCGQEVKNVTAMRKNVVQRTHHSRGGCYSATGSASTSDSASTTSRLAAAA